MDYDAIKAELLTQVREGMVAEYGEEMASAYSDNDILKLIEVMHEVVELNPDEQAMSDVSDEITHQHGYDIASALDNFVITDGAAATIVAELMAGHSALGVKWERTEEGAYTCLLLGMRYTVWPDKLMLTTYSFDPGILMFDDAPEAFAKLVAQIESEL